MSKSQNFLCNFFMFHKSLALSLIQTLVSFLSQLFHRRLLPTHIDPFIIAQIPIYAGAIKPLVWTHADTSSHIFGKDGYGEFAFDGEILGKVDYSKPASVAMVELSKTHATDLNILVLGPTTNVALAGALDREFFNRVKHIYVMGSSVAGVGNVRPGVEFNFAADPEANYILLNSTISSKLTLFPWETAVNSGYTNVRVISLESFNFYILKFEFLTKILLIR